MRVAKIMVNGVPRIVQIKKVATVQFAPGYWALVEDLDTAWHNKEPRWVSITETVFVWVRDFRSTSR